MTHLSDEQLSLLIDDQLASGAELDGAQAHLTDCPECEQRLAELRSVVELLHGLPEVELPRDFRVGPRPIAQPANVVRLRRWYAWTRAAGASLAAVFVLLVGGTVYVDLAAAPTKNTPSAAEVAPTAAPVPPTPAPAVRAAAPAPAGAQAGGQAAKPAAAPAAPGGESPSTDQVIATTSANPLPTLTPAAVPRPLAAVAPPQPGDPGAPWRFLASLVGILAATILLGALAVRHRLRRAEHQPVPED